MLVFWVSGAASNISKNVRQVFSGTTMPEHKFVGFNGKMHYPETGDAVLAMGTQVMTAMQTAGLYPKNRTINSLRGTPLPRNGGWYLPTFDPASIYVDAAKSEEIRWDAQLASRLVATGSIAAEVGNYGYADDLDAVMQYVNAMFERTGKPVDVSVDLETMGLDPYAIGKEIVSCAVSVEAGVADVVYLLGKDPKSLRRFLVQLDWLLNTHKARSIGANFKFDLIWIWHKYEIECSNFKLDTLLAGSLLDENRSNSLNAHAKSMTTMGGYDDPFNEKYDKAHMELVPRGDLLLYAGGDTDAALRCSKIIRKELLADNLTASGKPAKRSLSNFYVNILHPAARAFEKIERRGLLVDEKKYHAFGSKVKTDIDHIEAAALKMLPEGLRQKHKDDLKLSRPAIIRDFMFTEAGLNLKPMITTPKTGIASTTRDHLKMFADHDVAGEFVDAVDKFSKASKVHSTYYLGFMKHLRSDGLFHPSYKLFHAGKDYKHETGGTVTGRTSARDPAIQTLIKFGDYAKGLRSCFIAPKGYVVLSVDFNQGELRITAIWANEPIMLDTYMKGGDLHAVTAANINDMTLVEFMKLKADNYKKYSEMRQGGKVGNFGLCYGMGVGGYIAYALHDYDLVLTAARAKHDRDKFFDTYSALLPWHARQRHEARETGKVRSPLGRVRNLPLVYSSDEKVRAYAERQAINCLSDDTEIFTEKGWLSVDSLYVGIKAGSVNPSTGMLEMHPIEAIHTGEVRDEEMLSLEHTSISALSTLDHNWLVDRVVGRESRVEVALVPSKRLRMSGRDKVWITSNGLQEEGTSWSDDEVRLLGWVLTDGHYKRQLSKKGVEWGLGRVGVTQSKAQNLEEIDQLFFRLGKHYHGVSKTGQHCWEITCKASHRIRGSMPDKTLTASVLFSMSGAQRRILFETMLKGGGSWDRHAGRYRKFVAGSETRANAFLLLCVLIGQPARSFMTDATGSNPKKYDSMGNIPKPGVCWLVELVKNTRAQPQYGAKLVTWSGRVWCPTLKHATWVAKRDGKVFITGNSPIQATLSDMCAWAIAILDERHPDLWVCGMTHDNLLAYVPEDEVPYWVGEIQDVMENLPLKKTFGWEAPIPFPADAEAGLSLAELSPVFA